MTIIEKLRHLTQNNRSIWRTELESELRDIADALERSGALVPVKVGEECEFWRISSGYSSHSGKIYGKSPEIAGKFDRHIPIRLVAITEWDGGGDD